MSSNPWFSGTHVGEADGVPVDVAVAVGVGDGVPVDVAVAVGVGDGVPHGPPVTTIVSTRHPVAATLQSVAKRKRSLIFWPTTFGPRFATVLMKPPAEVPLHAIRPAIGLKNAVEIVAL